MRIHLAIVNINDKANFKTTLTTRKPIISPMAMTVSFVINMDKIQQRPVTHNR